MKLYLQIITVIILRLLEVDVQMWTTKDVQLYVNLSIPKHFCMFYIIEQSSWLYQRLNLVTVSAIEAEYTELVEQYVALFVQAWNDLL